MTSSAFPWRKSVGQFTTSMFSLLSKVSFARKDPTVPAYSFARDLIPAKGLMRTSPPGLTLFMRCRATPVPMDLPMTMMFCCLKPIFWTM